jgi:hypothetical protein
MKSAPAPAPAPAPAFALEPAACPLEPPFEQARAQIDRAAIDSPAIERDMSDSPRG